MSLIENYTQQHYYISETYNNITYILIIVKAYIQSLKKDSSVDIIRYDLKPEHPKAKKNIEFVQHENVILSMEGDMENATGGGFLHT